MTVCSVCGCEFKVHFLAQNDDALTKCKPCRPVSSRPSGKWGKGRTFRSVVGCDPETTVSIVTEAELAKILGVNQMTVKRWRKAGKIPTDAVGFARWLVDKV